MDSSSLDISQCSYLMDYIIINCSILSVIDYSDYQWVDMLCLDLLRFISTYYYYSPYSYIFVDISYTVNSFNIMSLTNAACSSQLIGLIVVYIYYCLSIANYYYTFNILICIIITTIEKIKQIISIQASILRIVLGFYFYVRLHYPLFFLTGAFPQKLDHSPPLYE